jgi:Pretoxin HINT domain
MERTDARSDTDVPQPPKCTTRTRGGAAPATLVATAKGEQAIGTLQVGQKVWAYNPKTHKMEQEPILHVWINHDNDLVDLTLTTTTAAHHAKAATKTSEVIHTNKKHPFLTKEKGFLPVGQITLGMHVLRADGTYGVVTGWKVVPGAEMMYDLEVAQDHTFTVGIQQWVVHNCGGGLPDKAAFGEIFMAVPAMKIFFCLD